MKSFKQLLEDDLDSFLDEDEFAEIHLLDGVEIPIVIDGGLEEYKGRTVEMQNAIEGIYQKNIIIYVKTSDYSIPEVGYRLKLDNNYYSVTSASDSFGLLTINLVSYES